jgi:uncharacterized protein (TIGR00255 family)
MTGYASRSFEFEEYTLFIEIRSLNNRFLELRFKLPFHLERFEEMLRKRLKTQVKRGKVDVFVKLSAKEQMEMRLLQELFTKYGRLLHMIEENTDLRIQVSMTDLLSLRHYFNDGDEIAGIDISDTDFENCFLGVLERFQKSRLAEGEMTRVEIESHLRDIDESTDRIESVYPDVVERYREQLRGKIRELIDADIDETRLLMEAAVFANKVDISEEVSRIRSHIVKMRDTAKSGGACGRELDFISQEINREVNTVGAKVPDYQISESAVRIKTALDKIKEQVRNIE